MENIISGIRDNNLKLMLAFGIGIHHAGLVERDRKTVEELFVNQRIQVLIATSTLAWGVNFPAHLVIIKGTEYFDGKTSRYVDFPITDVLQMMGRAGRPQFDDSGIAVIFVHDVKKHFYKKFLYEPFPVESNLLEVLPDHMNAEIVAGTVTSKQDAMDYLTWTYFFRRLVMNPTFYDLHGVDCDHINHFLSALVEKALQELETSYCLQIGDDASSISPLTMGRIASYYYISHHTARNFVEHLKDDASIPDLLDILSNAQEYAYLPVRHNEDQINSELATKLPLAVSPHSFDSAHTKTHLLLQAHFSQVTLPSTDYHTDTKSVLDQAIRILQAMLDMCADHGWLVTSLQIIILLQMVVQGCWWHDSSLLMLPFIEQYHLAWFRPQHSQGARKKGSVNLTFPIECLPELMAACDEREDFLYGLLSDELSRSHIDQITRVVEQLPRLEVSLELRGDEQAVKQVHTMHNGGLRPDSDWIPVHADKEYTLHVILSRINRSKKSDTKAYAPRFPKPKDEGWILVVGAIETREVLALKRIGYIRGRTTTHLALFTPKTQGRTIYTLYLMSDSYIGLDQQFDICLDVLPLHLSSKSSTDMAGHLHDLECDSQEGGQK